MEERLRAHARSPRRRRTGVEVCVDVLEPHLEIVVTHAGAPVSGHVEPPGGAELIVFVPESAATMPPTLRGEGPGPPIVDAFFVIMD